MIRSTPILAAAVSCLVAGCSGGGPLDPGRATATMYFAETDRAACAEAMRNPGGQIVNDPVEIGQFVYTHFPESGLVCRADGEGRLVDVFVQQSNRTASHRWIRESGFGILGTKHTFAPLSPDRGQS